MEQLRQVGQGGAISKQIKGSKMQREPVEGGQNGSSMDVIIYSTHKLLTLIWVEMLHYEKTKKKTKGDRMRWTIGE